MPALRALVASPFLILILILILICLPPHAASADDVVPRPLRALLITGGCCHDYTTQKQLIKEGLEQRAHVHVDVVEQGGRTTDTKIPLYEDPNWADGYDVVIHDECFSHVADPAWAARILQPHREGLPAVVVHCAMHCYRDGTDQWFEFCGVTSRRHGAHYPHEVLNRDATHPIMQGFGAGWANPAGELYWIEKVWPTAHPLASSKNREKGNEEVCVWTNQYADTRVFGTTLGHHNETVQHPKFLDLLTRGTLWACDRLNDQYLKLAQNKLVPVNVALGGKATASSEETSKDNVARHAVDGNRGTRWCASDGSAPQWLQIDLGQPQHITGCELAWESNETLYRYTVAGAADGETWQTLVDRSENQGDRRHRHEFDAGDVRYVRITFHGSNTGGWGSIREVNVFGDERVEVDPAAARRRDEQQHLSEVKLPAGFQATLFATPPAVNYPVFTAASPDGTLYVSCDKNGSLDREPNRGSVVRLRDVDGDGRADESKLFVANVDSPRGLVWDQDRLYLLHPPHLSAFIDDDNDGIADRQERLVENIAFTFKDRPADHTSNGVTLGIDGWLYLAIGDFGFMEARGADGRALQLRGGGVVRVRPDGTGLELFSRGTRNILEIGLDPLLNGFARDNTNDGGGWDIRLHHFSGLEDHGYPRLYMNFTDEIVPPLADYGGGSGCGALYLDEPGFPAGYGDALYTADWGRQLVFRHNVEPDGATFRATQEEFIGLPRVTDLDADALGRLYVASWKGATFTYAGEDVGYVLRVTPEPAAVAGANPVAPLPDFDRATDMELAELLASPSHLRRLAAQRRLLRRGLNEQVVARITALANDPSQPTDVRTAALFTLKQALGVASHPTLVALTADPPLGALPLRALTDREDQLDGVPLDVVMHGLFNQDPRVRLAALVGMARLQLIDLAGEMTPLLADPDRLVAHTAVQAMQKMRASEACFVVLDQSDADDPQRVGALRVLQGLHENGVVDGLILRLERERDPAKRRGLLTALCRLYFDEGPWRGDSWGTRPDTRGPYYQPEKWELTGKVERMLQAALAGAGPDETAFLAGELARHRISLDGATERLLAAAAEQPRLVPVVVAQLAATRRVPAAALPLLTTAARDDFAAPHTRAQAIAALLNNGAAEAFESALAALATLHRTAAAPPEDAPPADMATAFRSAWASFQASDALQQHVERLYVAAGASPPTRASTTSHNPAESQPSDPAGLLAEAGLLVVAAREQASPEARALAQSALEKAWAQSSRRPRLLEAVLLADARNWEPQVRRALKDENPATANIARRIAERWRLAAEPTPATPRVKALAPDDALDDVLGRAGDVELGRQVFARLSCNKCHTVAPGEALRGPHLPSVAKTYKRNQLAESLLLPSKSIAQGFVTNAFILDNGKTVVGFVTSEAADEITIRDNEGKELKIPTSSIDERFKQPVSVMPSGQVDELTLDEFASLVSYVESLAEPGSSAP